MQTPRPGTLREGVVVGLIAYAAVALFYILFDLLAARGALYTVDLLGKAVFRGLRDPATLLLPYQIDLTAIFLYNGLHLVVSLMIGVVVTWLVLQAEAHPRRGGLVLLAFVAGFVATVAAVGMLTAPIRAALPWWSIVVANLLAVAFAGKWLVRRHPGLATRLLLPS